MEPRDSQLLERQLLRRLQQTSKNHQLLSPNDRIMVAISGGKDSYTLLQLLWRLKPKLPFPIELVAVHLDQKQPGYDGRPLLGWLQQSGIPFEILSEDTYTVVTTHVENNATYCSLCSRLRRGILYTAAGRLGCNKIALGHHREDTLETFLLNLFYAGKMQAMPARYQTDDGRFTVIRPLIECAEDQIAQYAALEGFPILPCNLCGSQEGLKRDVMNRLMAQLEASHPNVKNVMLNALRNVRPTHLLDQDVLAAWEARPEHIRPTPEVEPREEHAAALPVFASSGRLRVIDGQ